MREKRGEILLNEKACREKFNLKTMSIEARDSIKYARFEARLPMQSCGSFDIMNNVYMKERFNLPLDMTLFDGADQGEIEDYGRLAKVMHLYQLKDEELLKSNFFETTTMEQMRKRVKRNNSKEIASKIIMAKLAIKPPMLSINHEDAKEGGFIEQIEERLTEVQK